MADINIKFLDLGKLEKEVTKIVNKNYFGKKVPIPEIVREKMLASLNQKENKDDFYYAYRLRFKLKDEPHGKNKTNTENVMKYNSYKEYQYLKGDNNVIFQVMTEPTNVFQINSFNEMIDKRFKTKSLNPQKRTHGYFSRAEQKALGITNPKDKRYELGEGRRWTKYIRDTIFSKDNEIPMYSVSFPMSMANTTKIPQRYFLKPVFDLYFPLVQEQESREFFKSLRAENTKDRRLPIKRINFLMKKAVTSIGERMVSLYKKWFDTRGSGSWKPNAPSTIRKKGRNFPMYETGKLRNALTFEVIEFSKRNLLRYAGWINPYKKGGAFERLTPDEQAYVRELYNGNL